MNVCVITAHPDDLEVGCSGTLLRLKQEGANIDSIVLVRPSAEVNTARDQDTVKDELTKSYSLSDFNLKVFGTPLHDNGRPNLTVDVNTITAVEGMLARPYYDLLITHNPQDSHQDHRYTHDIAVSAVGRRASEIWTVNQWPYCQRYTETRANVIINTSKYWDTKKKLINCYASYIDVNSINEIQILDRWHGSRIGVEYAESFDFKFRSRL